MIRNMVLSIILTSMEGGVRSAAVFDTNLNTVPEDILHFNFNINTGCYKWLVNSAQSYLISRICTVYIYTIDAIPDTYNV